MGMEREMGPVVQCDWPEVPRLPQVGEDGTVKLELQNRVELLIYFEQIELCLDYLYSTSSN